MSTCSFLIYRIILVFLYVYCVSCNLVELIISFLGGQILGGFSIQTIRSSANINGFIFLLSDMYAFSCIILFCIFAQVRTSNIMLNKNGESRHPYLVPDLCEETFSLSPLSMMLTIGVWLLFFFFMFFIKLKYFPSIPIFQKS